MDTTRAGLGVHGTLPGVLPMVGQPAILRAPWLSPGSRSVQQGVAAFDSVTSTLVRTQREAAAHQRLLTTLYRGRGFGKLMGTPTSTDDLTRRGLFGLNTKVADILFDGSLQLTIGTDRFQNLRCTPVELQDPNSGCRPKFKPPHIENQLQFTASGLISQRLHVDIDLDNQRDFNNANNIKVSYQGLEDEVLKRVDIGTVHFAPPYSRFLTAGIPTNNFGVNAVVEVGPVEVQALAATQKGSQVGTRTYTIGAETTQPQDREVADLNFEGRRFFWAVNPRLLPGYPAVDALSLQGLTLTPAVRPTQVRIYKYRSVTTGGVTNPNIDGITALGLNQEGTTIEKIGPLRWQLLQQGRDYWLDPSGLWFVLTAKLDPNDFLALSYTTADGGRVGTFPATDDPTRSDTLRLVLQPNRGPDAGSFAYEMRNVYRVAGSDLQPGSLAVAITLNRSESPPSGSGTWLSLLGLALPTDPKVFDTDNRLFPRSRDPGADATIHDHFVFFPSLQPFGDATRIPDPAFRNDSIYRTPEYLLFDQGPPAKYQLRLQYAARGGGDKSTLNLNALQIREGTEQIYVDGQRLVRGTDYSIAYGSGLVTFLEPERLFSRGTSTVTASYEERGFFAIAPTSIFGLTAKYRFNADNSINFVGLYQSEATAYNRPALGLEPTASLLAGVVGDFQFKLPSLTRFFSKLVSGGAIAPSSLSLNAELAFSRPDANRSGEAYLEEFENDAGIPIRLGENNWQLSSMPQSAAGVESLGFPVGFDSTSAVQLGWQNLVPSRTGGANEITAEAIDPNIQIVGGKSTNPETVAYITFHADTAGGIVSQNNHSHWSLPARPNQPRWRSMVTPLSLTGVDLSRNEFLEFWVFENDDLRPIESAAMRFVLDLGTVSEDALAIAPTAFTVSGTDTTWTGRQYVGAGRLDTERNPSGTFSATVDDIGILGDRPDQLEGPLGPVLRPALCRRTIANTVEIFPWGDLSARCTNGNGLLDTEDLDADLLLNARGPDEDVFRYVVDLRDPKYFVRAGVTSTDSITKLRATWKLYRVPLRQWDRQIGQPNIRLVKHLRFTFLTPPDNGGADPVLRFAMARMRLVGAPWVRRAETPILGISGSTGLSHGDVSVSSITTENLELGYVPPPGINNSANDINGGQSNLGQQVNEKSLRVVAKDLRTGERAEAYYRFLGDPRNLLSYRELKVWFRGRGTGWEDGTLHAYIKVGADARNFYWYDARALTTSWEPEAVIDLETWRTLRAQVQERYLRGEPPSGATECGGDPEAYVACDGPYLVHLRDPGISEPNLASVQEIATGIYHIAPGAAPSAAELWIDDIRLASPITEVGRAGALSARLQASDIGDLNLGYVYQNGQFRQISQAPSYRTTSTVQASSNLRLDRFLPKSLGIAMPMTVAYNAERVDPQLITGSDLRTAELAELRRPRSNSTTLSLSLRRVVRTGNLLTRALVNPLSFSANFAGADATTELSDANSSLWNYSLNWAVAGSRQTRPLGLGGLLRGLPRWLRESESGRAIARATFSLRPSALRFNSALSHTQGDYTSFLVPIHRLADTILRPVTSLQYLLRNTAGTSWQPLQMVTLNADWASTRDLRRYPDSNTIGRLAGSARRQFLGADVGVERDRNVTSGISVNPQLASWLRPRLSTTSSFILSRSLTTRNPVRVDGDTLGEYILPQTLNNARITEIGATIDPALLLRRIFGDSGKTGKYFQRLRQFDISRRRTRQSTFDLAGFDPSLGYQLGTGGFDAFLHQGTDVAIGAGQNWETSFTAGLELPFGLTVTSTYQENHNDRYQRATGDAFLVTETRSRDWPYGSVSWSRVFQKGPFSLVTLSSYLRQREGSSRTPLLDGQSAALSATKTRSVGPDLRVTMRNGVIIQGSATVDRSESQDNGNIRRANTDIYSGELYWSVRMPRALSGLRKPLRTRLSATVRSNNDCLVRAAAELCELVSDIRGRDLRGSFEADVFGHVTGGLVFGWVVNDLRYLDRKTSNISAAINFNIPLTTQGIH
ncbi:MAG: hypothetical protein ABIS00_13810 [Gemmatimonadales bacterium]